MAINGNISFRSLILGRIEEFVSSTDISPLVSAQTLAQIVVAVSNYTEEGKSLSPSLYITTDLDQLLQLLPGSSKIVIGELPSDENAPSIALKRCAPLAVEGWAIFLNCKGDSLKYGLFRGSMEPLSISVEESLLEDGSGDVKILRIRQSASNCVEIENHNGDQHTIFLSDRKESEPSPRKFVSDLAEAICSDLKDDVRESAQTLIEKILTTGLEESHGALIAVARSVTQPKFFKDGLFLKQPLDFEVLVRNALSGGAEEKMRLLEHSQVLKGMFGCDGIVLFNRRATLLGYNCFVKPSGQTPPSSGGARKRAFAELQRKLGNGLYAVFIRSQDGWSNLQTIEK